MTKNQCFLVRANLLSRWPENLFSGDHPRGQMQQRLGRGQGKVLEIKHAAGDCAALKWVCFFPTDGESATIKANTNEWRLVGAASSIPPSLSSGSGGGGGGARPQS